MKRSILSAAVIGVLGIGAVTTVSAQTVSQTASIDLCAGEYLIEGSQAAPGPVGNTSDILMWGYVIGQSEGSLANGDLRCVADNGTDSVTSPGPTILLPNNTEDDPIVYDLEITLYNALPRSTSLVIPGLMKPMNPVMFTPSGETIPRLHSFDTEVAPGGSHTYQWNSVSEGSYLYQSGTHQQVQIQMGLMGGLMSDAFTGTSATAAYPGLEYTQLYPLIYSEIDPVIHAGVAAGEYNTTDMKSTIGYAPKYFGITLDSNTSCLEDAFCTQTSRVSTFSGDDVELDIANAATPLVRMFNGSTRVHTPTLVGGEMNVIAEDGNLYPNYRRQYAAVLPPLKTKDVILDTSGLGGAGGTIKLIDSAMNLSNPAPDVAGTVATQAGSGVIANGQATVKASFNVGQSATFIGTGFTSTSPVAVADSANVTENGSTLINILANDLNIGTSAATVVSGPKFGTLTATTNGFNYQHDGSEAGQDSFIYSLSDGSTVSTAGVVINVDGINDAPVAVDDEVSVAARQMIEIRVLNNDSDSDSRSLAITSVSASALGEVSFVDKAVIYTAGNVTDSEVLTYTVSDGDGGSATANINVTVTAAVAGQYTLGSNTSTGTTDSGGAKPVTTDDSHYKVTAGDSLDLRGNPILGVLANDIPNGGLVNTGLAVYPEHGSIEMLADGTFEYEHDGSSGDSDTFVYEVTNDWGTEQGKVTITILPKAEPPTTNDDRLRVKRNNSAKVNVLRNDKDRDSDKWDSVIEITQQPQHGSLEILANKRVLYTPVADYRGKDNFKYRLLDGVTGQASEEAKVQVRVR